MLGRAPKQNEACLPDGIPSEASIFRKDTRERDFHRYRFTQVLDRDGNLLSSFSKLVDNVHGIAVRNDKPEQDFMFYLCYEGKVGCSRDAIAQDGDTIVEPASITDLGALPLF